MQKKQQKTTLVIGDSLYEMVYDPREHRTSYIRFDRDGGIEPNIQETEFAGVQYEPLSPFHPFVSKNIVLFPSAAEPYGDDAELIAEIQVFIHRYVDISPEFEAIAPYYVLFTWTYDRFHEVPYIRAIGDYGSGKSRFLLVVGSLCYKPMFTGGATTVSPIFRMLDEIRGTLILDEADYKHSDLTTDIVKILNMGYQKGGSVLRSEGKGVFEVRAFDVYGPKIVATRELFADRALESRFLVEHMSAGKLRKDIPRTLDDDFYLAAERIRNKLLMWRFRHFFEPLERREEVIESIHPRLNQIVIPLLSVMPKEEARDRLKAFIAGYHADLLADRGMSTEAEIVRAIFQLKEWEQKGEIRVKDIAGEINKDADQKDLISPKKVGWYLRSRLQLKTRRTREGYVVSIAANESKLAFWKERLGISDEDLAEEPVNDVNKVNDAERPEIRPEDVPF